MNGPPGPDARGQVDGWSMDGNLNEDGIVGLSDGRWILGARELYVWSPGDPVPGRLDVGCEDSQGYHGLRMRGGSLFGASFYCFFRFDPERGVTSWTRRAESAMAISPDGSLLATVLYDSLETVDGATGASQGWNKVQGGPFDEVAPVLLSSDDPHLFISVPHPDGYPRDRQMLAYPLDGGEPVKRLQGLQPRSFAENGAQRFARANAVGHGMHPLLVLDDGRRVASPLPMAWS